ncbi:ABC transporter substrate-binding protein, partial [Rhizobium ruizarguesonis]
GVTLNVAESFEGDADSRVYTTRLHKGMKWSDGHPYTNADIKFWYDTVFADKRVAVVGQDYWKAGGKPAKLEIVDEQ